MLVFTSLPTCSGLVNPLIRKDRKKFFIQSYSRVSLANFVKVLTEARALPHTCMGNWFCEIMALCTAEL